MFGNRLSRYKREYEKGELIFEEDEWGTYILIVDEGKVEIFKEVKGSELKIDVIGSGQILGEMALTQSDSKRSASARAKTFVSGWKFSERETEKLLMDNETFREKIFATLTKRLEETTNSYAELSGIREKLYVVSFILLAILGRDELLEDDVHELSMDFSPELLSYFFNVTLEKTYEYLNNPNPGFLRTLGDEERQKFFRLVERIINRSFETLEMETPDPPADGMDIREEVIEELRTLDRAINDLEDPEESFERSDFQEMKELHSRTGEVLDDYREETESDEKLIEKFEEKREVIQNRLKNTRLTDLN